MGEERRRRSIWVNPELLHSGEKVKVIEEEPIWRVIERLLDEHDARLALPSVDPEAAPSAPSPGPIVRVGRALPGELDETPREQGSQAVPA